MEEEATMIPEMLEVIITKEDTAIIGTGYGAYNDNMWRCDQSIIVPREEVDPEFDFRLDPHRVFETYMNNEKNVRRWTFIPYFNMRIHVSGIEVPEDIRHYLRLDG